MIANAQRFAANVCSVLCVAGGTVGAYWHGLASILLGLFLGWVFQLAPRRRDAHH